ncbi:fatty acid desaturase [Mesorhizobium sp. RP14(2022)]|uniref:Fatty acid desaturase n=1 Tax=Mesorhizobium liriopis TaxID=2953882 RepID=A0ABT1CC41_9HYPH|nr:fatty acid desaturase [Mesorhizobium liriopis]MCO6052288.1 fatty acid desaturase [Mesorhizobium liriopis]
MRKLDAYREPRKVRAISELAVTILCYVVLCGAMLASLQSGAWCLYALLILPAAGTLVRLFAIQHDCGHGSFLPSRMANDWIGRGIGVFTLTPYDHWRRSHAAHHATSGHLDKRGIGDVDTLTTAEFGALTRWGRLRYRLYRHPLVMFGFGPVFVFMLQNRLPFGAGDKSRVAWISVMATNAGVAAVAALAIWTVGLSSLLFVQLPVIAIAATAGVWLFFVQHQFEETHWERAPAWRFHDAALHGSSFYDLPPVLQWFTGNIGIHHVHHLVSRIPFYRLPEVLRDHPELREIGRLTLGQSFNCVKLVLWDEQRRRMVSFREFHAMASTAESPPGYFVRPAARSASSMVR